MISYTIYYEDMDFDYSVEQNYEDIFNYEFEKEFGVKYNYLTEALYPEHKHFVKDFESKCNKNQIHYYEYYTTHNFDFLDWLKDKYEEDARDAFNDYIDEDEIDDWWYELSEEEKKEIYEENNWR